MILGVVVHGEASVDLDVADASGEYRRISVVIDTGYSGHLTLPSSEIVGLGLTFVGRRRAWLADGRELELSMYAATVRWHDRERTILVSRTDGGPLLGMALLAGCRVTFDVVEGGQVHIEPLGLPSA